MFTLRRVLVMIVLLASVVVLSVSITTAQDDGYVDPCVDPAAATEEAVEAPDNSDVTFAVILPNPRGDRSFIDAAARGAERAIAELGVTGQIIETAGSQEHEQAVRRAIQDGNDLIITVAVDAILMLELAEEFPDQLFAATEAFFPPDTEFPDNFANFNVYTHENSYLAGIAAGMLTRTKIVGAVGGLDIAPINMFIVGFEEGVLSVCADCQTLRNYVGDFSDPVTAKEQALGMYAQGADILYQVAGRSGEGVLEAAAETGNFAIGVDSNQDDTYPGNVIVSAMKRVDNVVFNYVQSIIDDTFVSGDNFGDMAGGFAGLSWDVGVCSRTFDETGPEELVAMLPDIRMAIDEARAAILSGDLVVTNVAVAPPE
jgi:basic membrane protein A and related proteins